MSQNYSWDHLFKSTYCYLLFFFISHGNSHKIFHKLYHQGFKKYITKERMYVRILDKINKYH